MKRNFQIILIAICIFNLYGLDAQMSLKETPLKKQIENSSLVVEGMVISKTSFWSKNLIYTANSIEVYKVFKGEAPSIIEVITLGGTIGLQALIVSSGLKLSQGDVGVFALENTAITNANSKFNTSRYKPYGAIQGFYKYNISENTAVNPFNVKKGISDTFYNEIMSHTKAGFIEVSDFNIKAIQAKSAQSKNSLAPSSIAFSPSTSTAGTKSTITITIPGGNVGTDFGTFKGKVAFRNADNGGSTYVDALDSQVTWSSTSITVEIPSEAGTGTIRVTNSDFTQRESTTNLTITNSELNVVYDEDDLGAGGNGPLEPKAYRVQHINENGSGGYTWQMFTEFDSNSAAKAAFLRAFDTWRTTSKINWILGPTTSVDEAVFESEPVNLPATSDPSVNVIRFDNGLELDADELGRTYNWYKGCSLGGGNFSWFVAEMDLVFDDTTAWNFGPGTTDIFGDYDFESVALHELGHAHQLTHVINSNDVMHYALQFNEDQRSLGTYGGPAASVIQTRSTTITVCGQSKMTNYSLGVEENLLNAGIKIYPNPSNGSFYIKNTSLINLEKVTIHDVSGRLISEIDMSNASKKQSINLHSASKGIYFVNLYSKRAKITQKLILE